MSPSFPQYSQAQLVEAANFTAKSANYTAAPGDVVLVTTGTNTIQVTLPPVGQGGPVSVRKVDSASGAIKVVTNEGASVTIDGVSGATGLTTSTSQHVGYTFASDGSNWWVVGT